MFVLFTCDVMCTACVEELVSRPMYTELVEGESGQVKPQNNDAAAHGIRKFLVDVSNLDHCAIHSYVVGSLA